jgi:hypothetical protein
MTSKEIYEFLHKRWEEPTGIPLLLNAPSLKEALPEFQDTDRILITGSTGGSKTTMVFRIVIDMISYCLKNPSKSDVLVLYDCIELPVIEMYIKFLQFVFYKKLNKEYTRARILNRNQNGFDEELEHDFKLIQPSIDAFNSKIRFVRHFTPSEFGNYCTAILDDLHEIKYEGGKKIVGKRKNPKLKVVIVVDTTDSFSADSMLKLNKQESVKYWNKHYTNKLLGNTYGCIMLNVQQQDVSSQSAVFYKGERVDAKFTPSSENLSVDKESPRDHSLVLGVMNPFRFHIKEIEGMKISIFKSSLNLLYVLKSNFSTTGIMIPIYTNYNTLTFEEVPNALTHPTLYKSFLKQKGLLENEGVNFLISPAKAQFEQLFNKENGNIELE